MAGQGDNRQQGLTGAENTIQQLQLTNDTQKNIEILLHSLVNTLQNPNNLNLTRRAPTESQSNVTNSKWKIEHQQPDYDPRVYRGRGNILDDFEAGIKKQLMDSLAGGNFKAGMQSAMGEFTKQFGIDIRNIPGEFGKKLTETALSNISKSKMGQAIGAGAKKYGNKALDAIFKNVKGGDAIKSGLQSVLGAFKGGAANGSGALAKLGGTGAAKMAATAATTTSSTAAGSALMGVVGKGAAVMGGPWGLLIAAILYTVYKVLKPAFEGLAAVVKSLGKSFNRDEELRKKRAENAQKRLEEDMKWIAEQPFKILQEAAEKWADTWDSNLSKVGQTQGYDKESVYALYEGYADKLRKDNLESVVKATDVVDKLSSVLDTGLSGEVAEEFAYIATKLNAAIPTQDFFQYADTYASIAANAIAQGKSQRQALNEANAELEQFASNLLYSSRELAGGFSTGLKNSSDLFKNAVQIAQSAKSSGSVANISGTLTSVSAIIGAVAPDLASSLVDNIVQAAIGGNSDTIVALRSLAGINAGNTDFLRQMAEDPKSVFATLFTNLANLQNMSPDNYMEVAEGLADVFGIDKAAFARVDFNYLAQAISAMNVNNSSLEENLKMLESGQTTTSAEQLKAQEINRVILEEGLAYVIDSEAGRMIQQHMWDEQRDNALMNNEYAVSLQGSALEFLEGIRKSFTTLLNFLNPIGYVTKGIVNMTKTTAEAIGNEQDLYEILQLGAVGSNQKALNNLTTRGKDLGLTTSLIEMMGGTKGVSWLNKYVDGLNVSNKIFNNLLTGGIPTASEFNTFNDTLKGYTPIDGWIRKNAETTNTSRSSVSSRYQWGTVGKSFAQALQSAPINDNTLMGKIVNTLSNATQAAIDKSNQRMDDFIASAEKAAANNMSADEWFATAKEFGISDLNEALDNYGRTEAELRSYFEEHEARQGAIIEENRKQNEIKFWDYESGTNGIFYSKFWEPFYGDNEKYDTRMDLLDESLANIQLGIGELSKKLGDDTNFTVIGALTQIHNDIDKTFMSAESRFQKCLQDWVRYIGNKETYSNTISKSSAWTDLQAATQDQQTEATLALANALGIFSTEQLKNLDPQLQANVLLGEILVILQAMMQQQNTQSGGLNLVDTLSALGMGMTFTTPT